MNIATFVVLLIVLLIIAGASYRVYRMIHDNDMCYGCTKKCSECEDGNPINCTIEQKK